MSQPLIQQLARPSSLIGRLVLAPLWNRRNAALNDAAFDALELRPGDHALEVGFGGGYLLRRMAGAVGDGLLVGADVSPEMVAYCRRRFRQRIAAGRMELHCAPVDALPMPDGGLDKAVSVNSLFYWPSVPQGVGELARVLKAGGRLVLCFTDAESVRSSRYLGGAVAAYSADEVQAMLEAAGFCDVQASPGKDRHREFWCMAARR